MDEFRTEETGMENATPPWFRMKAVLVHLYTASGVVLALLMLVAAFQGEAVKALWLMLISLAIDSTDGLLARRFRVSEALPSIDGALLDNIVDYMTYVFAPMVLLWSEGYLPEGNAGIVLASLPLLACSYQFCRVDAKTDDHYFLGFPSYFNVLAFYVIVFGLSTTAVTWIIVVCSALVFIPIRYLYPTRTAAFRKVSLTLTALWLASYAAILYQMPDPASSILAFSVLYLVYYFGLSFYLSLKMLEARRVEEQTEA